MEIKFVRNIEKKNQKIQLSKFQVDLWFRYSEKLFWLLEDQNLIEICNKISYGMDLQEIEIEVEV